jgi:hypothetical protein
MHSPLGRGTLFRFALRGRLAFLADLAIPIALPGYCLAPFVGHSVDLAEHRPADGTIFCIWLKFLLFS